MLHKCESCKQLYLTSGYLRLCDYCGDGLHQSLELQVDDGVVEWWVLATQAEFGIEVERTRRWWIV